MAEWPRPGRCGACGRPAREFPSRRWEHDAVPCRARSQTLWRVDDFPVKFAVRFVPEGELLPSPEGVWHSHVAETRGDGFPVALTLCNAAHATGVRARLASEAEAREVARG